MKKNTYTTIANVLANIDFANKEQVMEELYAEINRGAEEKEAKNAEYAKAWTVVEEAMRTIGTNATIADIFSEVEKDLPQGFSKGRLQYGMTHQWVDKVEKHQSTKGASTYSLRG